MRSMLPCPALRAPSRERVISQSERRREWASCSCPPLLLSPCSFRFYRFGGRSLLLPRPSLPLALLAKSVQVHGFYSCYLTFFLSFFLYLAKFRKIFPL